jgi:hypothetical protein
MTGTDPIASRLIWLNMLCAALHLGLTVATFSVGTLDPKITFFTMEVEFNSELAQVFAGNLTPQNVSVDSFLVPAWSAMEPTSLRTICALFPFLSFAFHAGNAFFWRPWYLTAVCHNKCNPFRWIEYSMSASVMVFLLAYFSGILQLPHLIAITALVGVTQFFGLAVEVVARPVVGANRWSAPTHIIMLVHCLGYVPYLFAWTLVALPLLATMGEEAGPPDFVYALAFVQFLLFSCFGLPQIYVYACNGSPKRYVAGEVSYLVLSFVAKAVLTAILITNVFFQSRFECVFNPDLAGCEE